MNVKELKADPVELYRQMLRIRSIEEAIADRYGEQEMRCPVHLSIGQEAVAVGVCDLLKKTDFVFSGHRCHAHYLAKGGNLRSMLAEIYGKETGCSRGRGGSMHLIDLACGFMGAAPIVGSTIPIATGAAFGSKMKDEERIVAVFFGEGATEEGVFAESLNFAALKNLPVIFLCENNLYSVYSPLSVRQPAKRDIAMIAQGHGVLAFSGNGNDVLEVRELTARAVDIIRDTTQPVFIELSTYRWREHCGPNFDNDIGYRTEEEFRNWQKECPIARLEKQLIDESFLTSQDINSFDAAIKNEIEAAFKFAIDSPYPHESTMSANVYA